MLMGGLVLRCFGGGGGPITSNYAHMGCALPDAHVAVVDKHTDTELCVPNGVNWPYGETSMRIDRSGTCKTKSQKPRERSSIAMLTKSSEYGWNEYSTHVE